MTQIVMIFADLSKNNADCHFVRKDDGFVQKSSSFDKYSNE